MKRPSIRIAIVASMMLGLAACGSQESEFVDRMSKNSADENAAEVASCAYKKLVDSKGEEFIAEFLDSMGTGIPKGAMTVAGALGQCAAELG